MRLQIKSIYIKKRKFPKFKIEYDKTNKIRPSWVYIKNPQKGMTFLSILFKGRTIRYFTYLPDYLFLPVNYSKEDIRKYYNKFSEYYDQDIRAAGDGQNIRAARFLIKKALKYLKVDKKDAAVLDVGAGTGLAAEILVKENFKDISLNDNSQKMLQKAKEKSNLKNCKFICQDFVKFRSKNKFDLIISIFSLGIISYFGDKNEALYQNCKDLLNQNGIIVLLGHEITPEGFKTLENGRYKLNKHTIVNYYIRKK